MMMMHPSEVHPDSAMFAAFASDVDVDLERQQEPVALAADKPRRLFTHGTVSHPVF